MPDIPKLKELSTKTIAPHGEKTVELFIATLSSLKKEKTRRLPKRWRCSDKNLRYHLEYPTAISLVSSVTEWKFHSLKAFQNHFIANCFDQLEVHKISDNNSVVLAVYPVFVLLLRFFADVSPAFGEIHDLSDSDGSDAMTVLERFEELKILQRDCKMVVTVSAVRNGKNGIIKKHTYAYDNKLSVAKKHILFLENPEKPFLTQLEVCGIGTVIDFLNSCHANSITNGNGQTSSVRFCDQSSQTEEEIRVESKGTQTLSQIYQEMEAEILTLKGVVRSLENDLKKSEELLEGSRNEHKKAVCELIKKNDVLHNKMIILENKLESAEEELKETFLELGRVSVENARMVSEKKRNVNFNQTFQSKPPDLASIQNSETLTAAHTSSPEHNQVSTRSATDKKLELSKEMAKEDSSTDVASVQESREVSSSKEGISLRNIPTNAVERSLYNKYRLLLLTIADRLLLKDRMKFKEWANSIFSVDISLDISEVLFELDRKGVISAFRLQRLSEFFQKNLRFDLVHLIDCFQVGDYSHLLTNLAANVDGIPGNVHRKTNIGAWSVTSQEAPGRSNTQLEAVIPLGDKTFKRSFSNSPEDYEIEESLINNRPTPGHSTEDARRGTPLVIGKQVETDGTTCVEGGSRSEVYVRTHPTSLTRNKTVLSKHTSVVNGNHPRTQRNLGSNGNKLSKFHRALPPRKSGTSPQNSNDGLDDRDDWLCHHYKRRCYVKFSCCNKYWPCHRCHNNESKCGQKKLKSRDTKFVMCVDCGTQQPFSERSQFCTKCSLKFCKYFCPICKHLTGMDDNPYHCDKCGICRIHSDRSFHCDICGVCLDRQLLGKHKCRAGSAHDECCICLEDAFSGCQILPCSHKVHKECATQMIRSGITRCPICRESFAHKLEKRHVPSSKKQQGNH